MLMLGYLIIRTLVDLVLVMLTAIKEGPAAVAALVVELYASSTITYQRIRRKHRRVKQRRMRNDVMSSNEEVKLTGMQQNPKRIYSDSTIQSD